MEERLIQFGGSGVAWLGRLMLMLRQFPRMSCFPPERCSETEPTFTIEGLQRGKYSQYVQTNVVEMTFLRSLLPQPLIGAPATT